MGLLMMLISEVQHSETEAKRSSHKIGDKPIIVSSTLISLHLFILMATSKLSIIKNKMNKEIRVSGRLNCKPNV